ncbi:protein grip [Phtheirospermum japonicum]|uniref:Protein grip n=1 Tax=Phtheirospermum japonicum TaxID=374723 RepID=A0A830BT11_9LAMI|nr:protein grip [Phtheirospermum japonicum]
MHEVPTLASPAAMSGGKAFFWLPLAVAPLTIMILARQQAQREEELAQTQRHILALQEEIEELEHENRLHSQQEAMLKEELRNMERSQKREGVDLTYLKNVTLKLLETGLCRRPVFCVLCFVWAVEKGRMILQGFTACLCLSLFLCDERGLRGGGDGTGSDAG